MTQGYRPLWEKGTPAPAREAILSSLRPRRPSSPRTLLALRAFSEGRASIANSALRPPLSQLPTHFTSAPDPLTIRVHGGFTMDSKQVVFITGSSTGFGRLFAETLARAGHTVFATMRDPQGKNAKNAADLLALARRESLPIFTLERDVTSDASVELTVLSAIAQAARIDVAINN